MSSIHVFKVLFHSLMNYYKLAEQAVPLESDDGCPIREACMTKYGSSSCAENVC